MSHLESDISEAQGLIADLERRVDWLERDLGNAVASIDALRLEVEATR